MFQITPRMTAVYDLSQDISCKQNTTIDDIPEDILSFEIFQHMDISDLCSLASTCKTYNRLIREYFITIYDQIFREVNIYDISDMLDNHPILQMAAIKYLYEKDSQEIITDDLEVMRNILIKQQFHNLEKMSEEISHIDTHDWTGNDDAHLCCETRLYGGLIYTLSPDIITILINGQEITNNKHFIHGYIHGIDVIDRGKEAKYKLSDGELIDFHINDLAFGYDPSPYTAEIRIRPEYGCYIASFKSLKFLDGLERAYRDNNLPFPKMRCFYKRNWTIPETCADE